MIDESAVESLVKRHLEIRPLAGAVDVYKLLYQGVFGVGHILGVAAETRLKEEADSLNLDEQPGEPFLEAVSIDDSMVRVNLRPYMRRGLNLERLYSAMTESEAPGDEAVFLELWRLVRSLAEQGRFGLDRREIDELSNELRPGHCPPRHHSNSYRSAYKPAYRVVRRSVLARLYDKEEPGCSHSTA